MIRMISMISMISKRSEARYLEHISGPTTAKTKHPVALERGHPGRFLHILAGWKPALPSCP